MAPQPGQIDYHLLSPTARAALGVIGYRLAAGFTLDEIAAILDRDRPELRHLPLPDRVTKGWVSARLRELRREIEAAATTAS